jgi:hypothetical protein
MSPRKVNFSKRLRNSYATLATRPQMPLPTTVICAGSLCPLPITEPMVEMASAQEALEVVAAIMKRVEVRKKMRLPG